MNWVDILLILIVFFSAWNGWRKGFILGALDLVLLLGSFVFALWTYQYLSALFDKYIPALGVLSQPLAFVFVIVFVRIILSVVINNVLKITPREAHQNIINKALGIAPGLITGAIYATIVSALLLATPLFNDVSATTRESKIAGTLTPPAEWLEEKLSPVFDEAISKSLNKLTVEPTSEESVKLTYTITNVPIREDLEAKMLELVNKERAKHGLNILKPDPEIQVVARAHSRDMFARGYFSHINPDGKNPFDRMHAGGIKFLSAGENLALAQTLSIAHIGLMNSPGHRANILQPTFGRLGIGILDGGIHGLMITQNFRN